MPLSRPRKYSTSASSTGWPTGPDAASVAAASRAPSHVELSSDGNLAVALHPPLGVEGERIVARLAEAVATVCAALPDESSVETPFDAVDDVAAPAE